MTERRGSKACPACGGATTEGQNYCPACGAPLAEANAVACPACRQPNPERANFCLACGASLASPAQADRRVVTVLFADLSGYTQLTEEMDPEEVRELIAVCLEHLSDCVSRWGGHVDKFIGDCVMAIFGAPIAYENEAERAVRAALDMHDALRDWSVQGVDYRPQLRVGINTGPVVMGLFAGGGARNYTAVGDTVNVASRLQGLCETGRILVDKRTYEQTKHLFEFGDELLLRVKGRREPVQARHVAGIRATRGKIRGFEGRRAPHIGRGPELARLREQWRRAEEGAFELALISGPAGIGKSRLVEELIALEALADRLASGRSYPYATATPWEPIDELISSLHGLPADLPPGLAAGRISERFLERWSAERLAGLKVVLGSPISEASELQPYSPAERQELIFSVVRDVLEPGGEASPRLMVLEDLHWADRTTLEFLREIAREGLSGPLMLILISRPPLPGESALAAMLAEVEERIELAPLGADEARELVEALLGPHRLPAGFLDRVVQQAEGNPLFVEEMLKSLVGRGSLVQEEDLWQARGDPEKLEIPDTVESVLTTRIDGLDNASKSVLQYAAVVGRRFWSGVLADALAGRPVEKELDRLLEGAFVRPLTHSSLVGEREFLFDHLLLQQVAYEGMLRGLRSELHGAVAEWFERRLGGGSPEYDEWIAFHFERSRQPERAVPYLERAAHAASARGSLLDADSLVGRALDVVSDHEAQASLLLLAEDVATASGDVERRRWAISELQELAATGGSEAIAAAAAFRRARHLLDSGELPEAQSAAETALAGFEALGDVSQMGDALRLLGRISHQWGNFPEALRCYRSSLPLERQAGDRYGQAEIFDRLGLVQVDLGNYTTALDHFEAARDICVELGDRLTEARVVADQAVALRCLGEYERSEDAARSATQLARDCGSRQVQCAAELSLAQTLTERGAAQEAAEVFQRACQLARELGQPALEAWAWLGLGGCSAGEASREALGRARDLAEERGIVHVAVLALTREAELDLAGSDIAAADRASTEALRLLDLHGSIQGPEEAVLLTRARVLLSLGRTDEAAELMNRARRLVLNRAARIEDDRLRERYLEGVSLNREILRDGAAA